MPKQLRTAGDLRGFLADVLVGIQDGSIGANKANAIAKVSAQINQSLQVEVATALQRDRLTGEKHVPGSMAIASHDNEPDAIEITHEPVVITAVVEPPALVAAPAAVPAPPKPKPASIPAAEKRESDKIWCDQCDQRVTLSQAIVCKSRHCKAKEAA